MYILIGDFHCRKPVCALHQPPPLPLYNYLIWTVVEHVTDSSMGTRTFDEEGESQRQPVQGEGHGFRDVNDQRDGAGQPEEQVHGGVLPVHQVLPLVFRRVVQSEVRAARRKLLRQHP